MWVWSLGQEDSPAGGNGNPLQYPCQGNYIDRGAWWANPCGHKELDTTEQLSMLLPGWGEASCLLPALWPRRCWPHLHPPGTPCREPTTWYTGHSFGRRSSWQRVVGWWVPGQENCSHPNSSSRHGPAHRSWHCCLGRAETDIHHALHPFRPGGPFPLWLGCPLFLLLEFKPKLEMEIVRLCVGTLGDPHPHQSGCFSRRETSPTPPLPKREMVPRKSHPANSPASVFLAYFLLWPRMMSTKTRSRMKMRPTSAMTTKNHHSS